MKYTITNRTDSLGAYWLEDSDGNVLARIYPQGSDPHRQSVIDALQVALDNLNEGISRGWHDGKREIIAQYPANNKDGE